MAIFDFGPFRLDDAGRSLYRAGEFVPVTPKAFDILAVLVAEAGHLVTKDALMRRVWPDAFVEDGSIANNISVLRKLLNPDFEESPIATVARRGYRFVAPVRVAERPADAPALVVGPAVPAQDPLALPASHSWTWPVALAAIVLLGCVGGLALRVRPAAPRAAEVAQVHRAIAVLAMKDLSGDDRLAWLSTAIPSVIETSLAAGGQMRVVSGTTLGQIQQSMTPLPGDGLGRKQLNEIGRTVGCDLVLTGNYSVSGDRVRLDAHVHDIATGRSVGTLSVSGKQDQLLDLVSRAASELRPKLGFTRLMTDDGDSRVAIASKPEALRFYLLGVEAMNVNDERRSTELLTQATGVDPDFALAHAAMAQAWRTLGYDDESQAEARRAFDGAGRLSREDRLSAEGIYYQVTSDFPQAIDRFQALWNRYPDNVSYGLRLTYALMLGGRVDDARPVINQMKALTAADHDARVDVVESEWFVRKGQLQQALAADAAGADHAAKAKSTQLAAAIEASDARIRVRLGQFDQAMREFAEAKQRFDTIGDPYGSAGALRFSALALIDRGAFAEAAQRLDETAAIASRVHAERLLVDIRISQSVVARRLGRLPESKARAAEAVRAARAARTLSPLTRALVALGATEINLREFDAARVHLEEAVRTSREIGETPVFANATATLARLEVAKGRGSRPE